MLASYVDEVQDNLIIDAQCKFSWMLFVGVFQ